MAVKDYYKVLGVAESASADEIKKAYRRLAKKYHPDATGGDKTKEARFKEITEANETLGDEKKRAAYDEARKNPFVGGGPGAGPFAGGFNVDLGDLFSQMGRGGGRVHVDSNSPFGDLFNVFGGGGARRPQRGEDVITRLDVELPEAALGAEKMVTVDGRRLTIKIPPGIRDGKTIRLAGQGAPGGRNAPAGDLLIEIHELPHPRFRRRSDSADIEVDAQVPVDVAILGGKVDVPTLEGTFVTLTIPPGTSSGKLLRLRNKGAQDKAGRGDLYAMVSVQVPTEISSRARELIQEFAKITKK